MQDWIISIYRPVAGWKAIMYGPEGPESTGFVAYAQPHQALAEAQQWAKDEDIPCVMSMDNISVCGICGDYTLKGHCQPCHSLAVRIKLGMLTFE